MRRADNIPDSALHALETKKNAVRNTFPETATRSREGVQNALNRNPRLATHLKNLGYITLIGVGVYLIINVADLVSSIVEALNRTGGSWYYRGNNGADNFENIERCVLQFRSCGMNLDQIRGELCVLDPFDANRVDPVLSLTDARQLCNGYNMQREQTVCRASDANADTSSPQYYDISDFEVNHTIQCVEPYDLADLIADLGLDHLLGEDGLLGALSNSTTSFSNNFMTILFVVGGIVLLLFIGFVILKLSSGRKESVSNQ